MRNDVSTIARLRTRATARRAARRQTRAFEDCLASDFLSPNARREIEIIFYRNGASR